MDEVAATAKYLDDVLYDLHTLFFVFTTSNEVIDVSTGLDHFRGHWEVLLVDDGVFADGPGRLKCG